jgi:hypothetical protein
MDLRKSLQRIAARLANDNEDLRHTVLDVSDELLLALRDEGVYPARLRAEVRELRDEAMAVQPQYRSHRSTSALFDREGLGQSGRDRARNLAQRVIAVAKSFERSCANPGERPA